MAESTRERAIVAARDLIASEGVDALSMRKVARAVGVSAAALYRHFDDKQALIWAAVDEGFRRFSDYLTQSLGAGDALSRFHETNAGYFRFAADYPEFYRVIFCSEISEEMGGAPPEDVQQRGNATLTFLVDRIRECQDKKVFAPGDPQSLALVVWAQNHGLATLRLQGRLGQLDDAVYAELVRTMLQHQYRGLEA